MGNESRHRRARVTAMFNENSNLLMKGQFIPLGLAIAIFAVAGAYAAPAETLLPSDTPPEIKAFAADFLNKTLKEDEAAPSNWYNIEISPITDKVRLSEIQNPSVKIDPINANSWSLTLSFEKFRKRGKEWSEWVPWPANNWRLVKVNGVWTATGSKHMFLQDEATLEAMIAREKNPDN